MSLEENGAAPAAADTTPVAATPVVETAAPAEAAKPTMDDTLSKVWDEAHKPAQDRDEGGRFKAKDAPQQAAPANPDTTAKGTETPRPEGTAPAKLPVAWKDRPEDFAALPPKVQDFILTQEKNANVGLQKQAERYKPYEELDRVFEPWRERWNLEGATPGQKVQQLLAAQAFLDRDPVQAIKWLAESYKVNLGHFAAPQGQDQNVDPRMQAIQAELAALKNDAAQRQQAEYARELNAVQSELQAFSKDPAHEHFEDVRQDMVPFIQAGKSLKDAYDAAVWANPVTRAKLQEKQRETEAAKAREVADQARKANVVNVRSSPAGASPVARSIDETLAQSWDRIHARA